MKFQILKKEFKDNKIGDMIYRMLEYFATVNAERVEKNKQNKNREELLGILQDLANYVESGLKKKFSQNFVVLISEHPNYAIKYERHYFLGVKYLNFEIIILKTPFICIPARFMKKLKEEDKMKIHQFYQDRGAQIKANHIKTVAYQNKYYHTVHSNDQKTSKLQIFTEDYIKDVITKNIGYYSLTAANEKDLSKLAQSIQYDFSYEDKDFNWCCITSKQQIYTEDLMKTSDIFYHCAINDDNKSLNINGMRDTEILIYKKFAVFESVLKNIVTGKFYEVELKHIVILAGVIIFFILMGVCKKDYASMDASELSWFEEKVCLNKSSIISSVALLFIFAVITGFIKRKINAKEMMKRNVQNEGKANTNKKNN